MVFDVPLNGVAIDTFDKLKAQMAGYADATGNGTRIDLGGGHDLVIYGVSINQFTASDFQFDPLQ